MKKLAVMIFAVILLASVFSVKIPITRANILEVGPGKPYSTIQSAIDAASSGDTILVYDGIYREAILIDKPLDVIGSGASTTFINGSGVTLSAAGLVKITANSGNVKFSGFTVSNAEPVGANSVRIEILTQSNLAGPTYTVSYNKIYGTNDPDEEEDYGFYAQSGKENLIFTHNLITQTGANNIVLELHTGSTEISYNTLDAGVWGTDSIFFMTYNGIDVTTLQNVSCNTFDMGTGGPFDYDHRSTAVSFNSPGPAWGLGEAKFTNMVIAGNTINNLESCRRGIGFWNGGTGDNLKSPTITGNTINGVGAVDSWGIDFIGGPTSNALITYNSIQDTDKGIFLRTAGCAPNIKIHYNNIAYNTIALDNTVGPEADARFNWWSDASGPTHASNIGGTGDTISDNVDYSPWLNDPFEVTPRTYHVNPTGTIQEAIDEASSGDAIVLSAGTYIEGPQLVINKNLAIRGADASTTIIKPASDTGSSGDSRGWFLVNSGVTFNLNKVTLDGIGHQIYQAIRDKGQGTVGNCIFKNIVYPGYAGFAVVAFGGNVDVINCVFTNIGRVGVLYFGTGITGSVFSGNSYVGKYNGDWLDYGVEVGAGAHVTINGNTINKCTGIASVDGSTSAGILVTTYYGAGSEATITHNDISNCTYGIAVGYDESDTSLVVVHENNIYKNEYGLDTTAPTVDAARNWWGDPTGPYHPELNPSGKGDKVSNNVHFEPWLIEPYPPPAPVEALLYIYPAEIEFLTPAYGETFTVDIKLANVTNLFGYEFKFYWNTTLLNLVNVQITPPWPKYFIGKNETDRNLGRYWLGVCLVGTPTFSGSTTLAKLTFKIAYDPLYPQNKTCKLDLADTILTAPMGELIYHMTHDGTYYIYSVEPKIMLSTFPTKVCYLGSTVYVDVIICDVVNLYEFSFKLAYNTTMLDVISVDVNFLKEPFLYYYSINETAGYVMVWAWSLSPASSANGTGCLVSITMKATMATIWPDPPLTCSLHLYETQLKTKEGIKLLHTIMDGLYTYQPKPGDLNADGKVDLIDLRMVAYYYDPAYNRIADLNRDGKVNIIDLSIVAYYYEE